LKFKKIKMNPPRHVINVQQHVLLPVYQGSQGNWNGNYIKINVFEKSNNCFQVFVQHSSGEFYTQVGPMKCF
jgi:hypothetical protein